MFCEKKVWKKHNFRSKIIGRCIFKAAYNTYVKTKIVTKYVALMNFAVLVLHM